MWAMSDAGVMVASGQAGSQELSGLRSELRRVREHVLAFEREMEPVIERVHPGQQLSARNLVDYLGLRQLDFVSCRIS